MKPIIWITGVMLLLFTGCKKSRNMLTEKEVLSIIQRFDAGWETKNLQLVDSVLSPDYIYFTQSGGTFSREGVVQTAGSSEYTLESMQRSALDIHITGNTAIISTRWKGKGVYRGVAFDEDQRCSIVVVKQNGRVSILSEHCTPVRHTPIFH
jgi:hypothetical protein